jgi:hypothetical protein
MTAIPAVLLLGLSLWAPPGALSPGLGQALSEESFKTVATVAEFPEPVKKALATALGQPELRMSDPGGPFNATDVVLPGPEPVFARLVVAGVGPEHAIIHYEHGGITHDFFVLVLSIKKSRSSTGESAALLWSARPSTRRFDSVAAIVAAIRDRTLR